jgi:two-component system cell cycle sensor histidine kinase/response regulator CckA
MKDEPSLDDIFAVMSAASFGDAAARVSLPEDPQTDEMSTRLAIGLNVLLDDFWSRAESAARLAERLRILASAAHEFSAATQDHDRVFDAVARRIADVVKDLCVVLLVSEDGHHLLPMAVHGPDADAEARTRGMYSEPLSIEEHPISRRVLERGEPILAARVDAETLRGNTTPEFLAYVSAIGLHSILIAPLRIHERSLGLLILTRYRPESPPFDDHDKNLVCALADHAAIAIANSRSYAAERAARAAAETAKDELLASEARYRLMFDNSPLPKWMYDLETLRFLAVNDAAVREYGYSRKEFLAMTVADIRPAEDVPAFLSLVRESNQPKFGVWRHKRKTGEIFEVEVTMHTFKVGERTCRLAVTKDVTERLRLEEQLRQSQKMEAVGRLAGGVAHDFNNVLSVILSYGDMLLADMKPGERMRDDVEEIRKAGLRAADLTRQLLMFSRQQVLETRVLDLNELLTSMDKMLQRILGADVDLVSLPGVALGRVRADPSSIEQVIMNLVVNARDAMPTGGKLTMETGNVVLDEAYALEHLGVKPGRYVMLAVTDTGTGIDKATLTRIFEPFFTTKESGKGTGLGLSTVFGIVQQSGGSVWVYSEPGQGTTFKVYLPRVDGEVEAIRLTQPPTTLRGSETILVVEDDDQVRAVACGILRRTGYHVIEARNAGEALLHSEKHPGTIHLLLTDVVMPQMSGPELAKRLASVRPGMKVLCMSGYTDDSIVRHGVLDAQIAYLQKPITPETLTTRVREVLMGAPNGARV